MASIHGTPVTATIVNGASSSKALPALSTTLPNCIIIVVVATEKNATAVQTVSSITDSLGLTFAKRSSHFETDQQNLEVWWALAAGTLSSDVITVNLSAAPDDATLTAFAVVGVNTALVWDPNASLPAKDTQSGATASVSGVSTTKPQDMLLAFVSNRQGPSYAGKQGSGFTMVTNVDNAGGARFSDMGVEYQNVLVTQSGITVSFAATSTVNWIIIADALVSGSTGPVASQAPYCGA